MTTVGCGECACSETATALAKALHATLMHIEDVVRGRAPSNVLPGCWDEGWKAWHEATDD